MSSGNKITDILKPGTARLAFLVCLLQLLVACGSGSSDTSVGVTLSDPPPPAAPPPVVTVSGGVVKGPLVGATINIFAVDTAGLKTGDPIATATTDASGNYTADLGDFTGVYLVEASGGVYLDEATGKERTVPVEKPLRAVANVAEVTSDTVVTATVTPLTEIAVRVAEQKSGGLSSENVTSSNDEVGALFFGETEGAGAKLLGTTPADVTDSSSATKTDDERLYGLMLGAISELDDESGSLDAAISVLAADIASTGNLATSSTALIAASDRFISGASNNTGLTSGSAVSRVLTAAATGVGAALAPSTEADITSFAFSGSISSVINRETGNITVIQPAGTDLAALSAPTIATSFGATAARQGEGSFAAQVTYIVTAADGVTTKSWVVTVSAAAANASPLAEVTGTVSNRIQRVVINKSRRSVVGSVQNISDLNALDTIRDAATILSVSSGASIVQSSGSFGNGDALFAVTAEDGSTVAQWSVVLRVNLPQPQPALSVTNGDLNLLTLGDPVQLSIAGGVSQAATEFTSSNSNVASVSANGLLTVTGAGSASITVSKSAVKTNLVQYLAATTSIEVTVAKRPQATLAYPVASLSVDIAGSVSNPITGGSGTGAVSYASSNTSAATVSDTGAVSLVGVGSTTISATKAGDANYLESNSATFELTVTQTVQPPPQTPNCVLGQSKLDECVLQ